PRANLFRSRPKSRDESVALAAARNAAPVELELVRKCARDEDISRRVGGDGGGHLHAVASEDVHRSGLAVALQRDDERAFSFMRYRGRAAQSQRTDERARDHHIVMDVESDRASYLSRLIAEGLAERASTVGGEDGGEGVDEVSVQPAASEVRVAGDEA